jgi:type I restriction enzyme M protein
MASSRSKTGPQLPFPEEGAVRVTASGAVASKVAPRSGEGKRTTQDIVQKLWNLCHVLRDDGITYHQYVTELTYLLFLKMAKETGRDGEIPEEYRWDALETRDGVELLDFYRRLLVELSSRGSGRVQAIFANAGTSMRQPKNLRTLVEAIDGLDWFSAKSEGLGDLYEGLLEKNAEETKSGAGQYFTPRPLIESIVACVQPKAGESVQDPAVGTAGFLIVADRFVKQSTDDLFNLSEQLQLFQKRQAFYGVELVPDVQRLALMNAMLHGIEGDILLADALGPSGAQLPKADIILANPPFGTKKGGGGPSRDDLTFVTSNKQLAFLQHIYRGLKVGGRAAVVLPDNVLFEEGVGQKVRADLMDKCNLHTILRLPTGIFYAQGVKTNVLFFTREGSVRPSEARGTAEPNRKAEKGGTKGVWFYDLRTNMPSFGKRTPLTRAHFEPFEKAFGEDPHGLSRRTDEGEQGRFRLFSREEIAKRGDNLDISWLKDDSVTDHADLPEPAEIADQIATNLALALDEIRALQEELGA